MSGIRDLEELLASLKPRLATGRYVYCTFPDLSYGDGSQWCPLMAVEEQEGLTLVIPEHRAREAGLHFEAVMALITLEVHSSLEAVGLTAAVAKRLTQYGISANVVAGFYHDHILVPANDAERALAALQTLSTEES